MALVLLMKICIGQRISKAIDPLMRASSRAKAKDFVPSPIQHVLSGWSKPIII
jgi:hypothetical protein